MAVILQLYSLVNREAAVRIRNWFTPEVISGIGTERRGLKMKTLNGRTGLFASVAAVATLGLSSFAMATPVVTATYVGQNCPGTCMDLKSAGYSFSPNNIGVVNPATTSPNLYKTPGSDTGNMNAVLSYNVTSSGNNPQNATNPITVTGLYGGGLNDMFSFYWGSIDNYNLVQFLDSSGNVIQSFTGNDAASLDTDYSGGISSTTTGHNYNIDGFFTFTGDFSKVELSSSNGVAFEFAVVPEPGTLALFGLALVGLAAAARRGSKSSVAA